MFQNISARRLLHLMRQIPASTRRSAQRGMTLIEIMVVVIIISLVAGVVGVSVIQRLGDAKRKLAVTQIHNIADALDLYKLAHNHYPTTAEGLQALVTAKDGVKPFMAQVPKDPWGNDFVYVFPGVHNPGGFDLMSYGEDLVQGGEDDIGNWDMAQSNS